jgi:hypothetical protein
MPKHFPKGLDARQRDKDGEIRQKRGDTQAARSRYRAKRRPDVDRPWSPG